MRKNAWIIALGYLALTSCDDIASITDPDYSAQFITLPSGYKAFCNRQGYRQLPSGDMVTDEDNRFVKCDARIGPPWDDVRTNQDGDLLTSDEINEIKRQKVEAEQAEVTRLSIERNRALHQERTAVRLKDRLDHCNSPGSSIYDFPEVHKGPIPIHDSEWQNLKTKCVEKVNQWSDNELKSYPNQFPPRSQSLSFYPRKHFDSISENGEVFLSSMDESGNISYYIGDEWVPTSKSGGSDAE